MAERIDVEIPAALVADYQDGRTTVAEIARRLGVGPHIVSRQLRSLGVDTSQKPRKRLKFSHQVEEAQHLLPGAAYTTVADLYRKGYGTLTIRRQLSINPRTVTLILIRMGVKLRSPFSRSVFEGRGDQQGSFAERLQALRDAQGLSKKALAERSGLCPTTIWHLETCQNGPHWETLVKVCAGLEVEPEELGVDWKPPWLEEEKDEPSEGPLDLPRHQEAAAELTSFAFNYDSPRGAPLVDVPYFPTCNMMYDTGARGPGCPSA